MNIELNEITIKELHDGYEDKVEEGVVGYNGKLDIRPRYQREFIYDDKKRNAVIDTISKNHPLNSIYWAVKNGGGYEVIDGQQRIISICQYVEGDFSINNKYFHSLQPNEKEKILNYRLAVYFCSGTDSEKLEWFQTINIAGEELTTQELRNAVYSGSWVTHAKIYFSKRGCPAYQIGAYYLDGSSIRQDYLQTAIQWISNGKIENYMSKHHHDPDAKSLCNYFENVIDWIEKTFIKRRSFMKGLPWGLFYNKYKDEVFDSSELEKTTSELIKFSDKIKPKGIYEFILTSDPKCLSPRTFPENIKHRVYEKQNNACNTCKKKFDLSDMEADHIKPWFNNGETIEENCQMLCAPHHYEKTTRQTRILRERLKIKEKKQ